MIPLLEMVGFPGVAPCKIVDGEGERLDGKADRLDESKEVSTAAVLAMVLVDCIAELFGEDNEL